MALAGEVRPPRGAELAGIIITGASSEIGSALARHLLAKGEAKLLFTSRTRPVPADLLESSSALVLSGIDLTEQEGLQNLLETATGYFRGPFALVHSVGDFWFHKGLEQTTLAEAHRLYTGHYLSLFGVLHFMLPLMAQLGGGRILALSCTSVGFSHPEMSPFTSAKAAVESLIRCTANEWANRGVSANAIALSTVATQQVLDSKPLAMDENYLTLEELCQLVSDLLRISSPYLSGNVIRPLKYSKTYYHTSYFDRNPSCLD